MKTNLTKNLNIDVVFFVSSGYWTDTAEIHKAVDDIISIVETSYAECISSGSKINKHVISSESDTSYLADAAFAVFVPMSGGVQPWALEICNKYEYIAIWAMYANSKDSRVAARMLERNAAPAVMEIYSVLKRNFRNLKLAITLDEINDFWKCAQAVFRLKGARLLLLGAPEPWVISCCKDFVRFKEKLGIIIKQESMDELYRIYNELDELTGEKEIEPISQKAMGIQEPTEQDLRDAGRLYAAIKIVMENNKADALALACFKMLNDIHTTGCVALSRFNDSVGWIGACEGDLDSAVTLMLVKALTGKPSWMANPNLQKDGSVNFVHCTAPLCMGEKENQFVLRNHHESGIGVSPEVKLDAGTRVTIVRVGNELQEMSIFTGAAYAPINENTCRTRLCIQLDNREEFLEHALGCHQIIVYGDYKDQLKTAAEMLNLKVMERQNCRNDASPYMQHML